MGTGSVQAAGPSRHPPVSSSFTHITGPTLTELAPVETFERHDTLFTTRVCAQSPAIIKFSKDANQFSSGNRQLIRKRRDERAANVSICDVDRCRGERDSRRTQRRLKGGNGCLDDRNRWRGNQRRGRSGGRRWRRIVVAHRRGWRSWERSNDFEARGSAGGHSLLEYWRGYFCRRFIVVVRGLGCRIVLGVYTASPSDPLLLTSAQEHLPHKEEDNQKAHDNYCSHDSTNRASGKTFGGRGICIAGVAGGGGRRQGTSRGAGRRQT